MTAILILLCIVMNTDPFQVFEYIRLFATDNHQ